MQNKVVLIIPFFNESKTILKVSQLAVDKVDLIIAVDDGSTDGASEIISRMNKVLLIKHPKNLGKGAALKTGFIKSVELNSDITITMDADLQHDPKYLPEFIQKARSFDVVIGNRMNDISRMPYHRRLSNYLTSYLISVKTGVKIPDSQCGYRAFRTDLLNEILPLSKGFEAESEMIIRAAKAGYSFGFVNIPAIYGGDNSKMRNLQATFGFITTLFRKY